jgi:hypothetical protein
VDNTELDKVSSRDYGVVNRMIVALMTMALNGLNNRS